MKSLCTALLVIAVLAFAPRMAPSQDLDTIIEHIDTLFRSKSSHSSLRMEIVTPDWQRTLELEMWTEEMDKTLVRIHAPRKEKGVGTLRIDTEMWNYLPKTNKVIKVPPSMMNASWMGSDFTNDDLVNEVSFIHDYSHEFTEVEDAPELICIKSYPHEGVPVVWGWVITGVEPGSLLPQWQRFYEESGEKIRTLTFSEPRTFGTRTIPTLLTLVPHTKLGNQTSFQYLDVEFDAELPKGIFSLRTLRSGK